MFRALVLEKEGERAAARLRELPEDALPPGGVTVEVAYSSLNYKDGLCLSPAGGGLVKTYPHVAGIDFAGRVRASEDARFAPGQEVILTGWRVGELHWGGYAALARVPGDYLVPLPAGLSLYEAMALGTAGLTAMFALMALEEAGLRPGAGPVLVTGAAGGVGSLTTALCAALGYEVTAVTGRPEAEGYLRGLGAQAILPRAALAEPAGRPLERESWAGVVDSVGGTTLARALGQLCYGGAAAAVGLAGGADLPASVIPFLLRGVKLLGIDSVMAPLNRRSAAWARLAREMPKAPLAALSRTVALAEVPELGAAILKGGVQGRVVVDVKA